MNHLVTNILKIYFQIREGLKYLNSKYLGRNSLPPPEKMDEFSTLTLLEAELALIPADPATHPAIRYSFIQALHRSSSLCGGPEC